MHFHVYYFYISFKIVFKKFKKSHWISSKTNKNLPKIEWPANIDSDIIKCSYAINPIFVSTLAKIFCHKTNIPWYFHNDLLKTMKINVYYDEPTNTGLTKNV